MKTLRNEDALARKIVVVSRKIPSNKTNCELGNFTHAKTREHTIIIVL